MAPLWRACSSFLLPTGSAADSSYLGLLTLSPFGLKSLCRLPLCFFSMPLRPAAARVFRDRHNPKATDRTYNTMLEQLARRQQLNSLWERFYYFAERFQHGHDTIQRLQEGNHWQEWSEQMILCVQVQLNCMIKDKTLGENTSEDILVSCLTENSVSESIDVPCSTRPSHIKS